MGKGQLDKEIEALATISNALADLQQDAIQRILLWAANRYGVKLTRVDLKANNEDTEATKMNIEFSELDDIIEAANPTRRTERILLVAYWLQVIQSNADFASQELNAKLKDMGHGVPNITSALNSLMKRKPALIRQVRKAGKSKQSRKKYRLTAAGKIAAKNMISSA